MKKLNNNKIMFILMMLISNLMIMFCNNWLNLWIWLEINLISFISFLLNYKNYFSIESSLIYFLIQTLASILFLYSIMMSFLMNNFYYLIMISMMIKLSAAPLHFWMPLMIENMNWMNLLLLLTWQKIGPLIILFQFNLKFNMMMYMILISMIMGSIMGLNYSSLKKIMMYSSINQMSWILLSMYFINKLFKLYFMFYLMMMTILMFSFNKFKMKYINNLFLNNNNNNFFLKLFILNNILSLGGLPPFLGFFPKMMLIFKFYNSIFMFFMLMFSMINLFFYLRIIISFMMLNSMKINFFKNLNNNYNLNSLIWISTFNNLLIFMLSIY